MDVNCELIRNGRVFIYRLSGSLDFAEIERLTTKWEDEILTPALLPVYYISDFTGITNLPAGTLSRARNLARKPSPKLKLNVIVTSNMFISTMVNIFAGIVRTMNLQVVPTIDDALAIVDRALAEEAAHTSPNP